MSIFKQLVCKHDWEFKFNLHGDAVIYSGYKRTAYRCKKCGQYKFLKEYIHRDFSWHELTK